MISFSICDPDRRESFEFFRHQTTTYVEIPHDSPSLLWVNIDQPCKIIITSEDRLVLEKQLDNSEAINLSDISIPFLPARQARPSLGSRLGSGLSSFFGGRHSQAIITDQTKCLADASIPKHRLYKFTATIKDLAGHHVLATQEFHILCDDDFAKARRYQLSIMEDPEVISPDTIADRSEGSCCERCQQDRSFLESIRPR